jgi:hypothetical protein
MAQWTEESVAVELLALEHGQPVFSAAVPWEPR